MNTEGFLLPDFTADAAKILEPKRRTRPRDANRASDLDDACLRRLVYARTNWADAVPVDIGLQGIFSTGNELEPVIERILAEMGRAANPRWRIVGTQVSMNDKFMSDHNIGGTADGMLQFETPDGQWVTAMIPDVKSCSANVWNMLDSYESLSRFPWTRKYRGQMQTYMLGYEMERSVLIFVNKQNLYQIKAIEIPLDLAYAERLIQKADKINAHVKAKTLPDKINQPEECSRCKFAHICLPELESNANMELLDNPMLAECLQQMADLKEGKTAYDAAERELGKLLPKGQDVICGDFIVMWKEITKNIKAVVAADATTRKEWRKTITPI